jgi:hypothetical protein
VRISKGKSMKMLVDFWRQNPSGPLILEISRCDAVVVRDVGLTGFVVLDLLPCPMSLPSGSWAHLFFFEFRFNALDDLTDQPIRLRAHRSTTNPSVIKVFAPGT